MLLAGGVILFVSVIVLVLIFTSGGAADAPETPTVAAVATPSETAEPATPPADDPATPSPTTEPTVTATPTETPTPTPEPTPEPTPTPVVGDFGPLPPAEVPSGNSASRALNLDYRLDMSLQLVPQTAPVFQMLPRSWTEEEVAALAENLELTGEVVDQGGGSFRVSGNGSLYISGNLIQYTAAQIGTPVAAPLPTDDVLTQAAHTWLVNHGIIGADGGPGRVVDRNEDAGIALVVVKPVEPQGLLTAVPSAAVTIAADGSVVEANVQWPEALMRSEYGLRDAADLWSDVQTGRAYVEIDAGALPDGAVNGTMTATSADLAYTLAGSPATTQYLVPLVVFAGQADIEGADGPIPVKIYVRSVAAQTSPRG